VRFIESTRKRLSPQTKTDLDELGVILPTDNKAGDDVPPPARYWNLAGSLYAYLYIELFEDADRSDRHVADGGLPDAVSEREHDGLADQSTQCALLGFEAHQGFVSSGGSACGDIVRFARCGGTGVFDPARRKLLLANERNRPIEIELADADQASARTVDEQTGDGPARMVKPVAARSPWSRLR